MNKQLAQICASQYIRGNSDARPGPGKNPSPHRSGPYPEVYDEGYADAQRQRKALADPETPLDFLREEESAVGPATPPVAFEIVHLLRGVQKDLSPIVNKPEDVYRVLNEAAAEYIAGSDDRERRETIAEEVAREVAAELKRRGLD